MQLLSAAARACWASCDATLRVRQTVVCVFVHLHYDTAATDAVKDVMLA